MSADPDRPLSRRDLFTSALPRGLANLAGGLLRAPTDLVGLYGLRSAPEDDLSRHLRELLEQERREHPEWFADLPDDPR